MPYSVRKKGQKYVVVVTETGKVMGTHDSKEKARRQVIAIKINEGK